jgi:hypothetical protein
MEGLKDHQASLDHLRKKAAETSLIADLATDKAKRETFAKLVGDLKVFADEIGRKRERRGPIIFKLRPGTPPLSSPPAGR